MSLEDYITFRQKGMNAKCFFYFIETKHEENVTLL